MSDHHASGPECYANALELLDLADRCVPDDEEHRALVLKAGIWAQLALAAATVGAARNARGIEDGAAWAAVTAGAD